ncbi:MAG: SWIM zinc finger family protein [Myxococcota bacterium]|jgi:hypothetical protein|nr:SWIM zinc finger family protein [Myxococcota bacterium]
MPARKRPGSSQPPAKIAPTVAAVPAPLAPTKGLHFWVQTGSHYSIGQGYAIGRVNGRSFYVVSAGRTVRHDLAEWTRWLGDRLAEGQVLLEGQPMQPPVPAGLAAGIGAPVTASPPAAGAGAREDGMDVDQRDRRVLRAVRDVLRTYRIEPGEPHLPGEATFWVLGGQRRYLVSIDTKWRLPPSCTCPDAGQMRDGNGATFCKHVIAVLLSHPEHRHQLIDLLL